jgi:hypothetical protein
MENSVVSFLAAAVSLHFARENFLFQLRSYQFNFFHHSKNVIGLKQIVFYFQLREIKFFVRAGCQPRVYSSPLIGLTSACQCLYECPHWGQKTTVIKTVFCLHYSVLTIALGLLFPERIQVLIGIFWDDLIGRYHACTES